MNLFLLITCSIYKKHELKVRFKHWYFNAIEFQIMSDGQKFNFFAKIWILSKFICYYVGWTHAFFWFIKLMIGVWTTVFSRVKTCPNNITLVLKYMSDGNISILGNRKKVCYKYNITDLPWHTFLLEGTIVWYNSHIQMESHIHPIYRWNWMVKR